MYMTKQLSQLSSFPKNWTFSRPYLSCIVYSHRVMKLINCCTFDLTKYVIFSKIRVWLGIQHFCKVPMTVYTVNNPELSSNFKSSQGRLCEGIGPLHRKTRVLCVSKSCIYGYIAHLPRTSLLSTHKSHIKLFLPVPLDPVKFFLNSVESFLSTEG